MSKDNHKSDVEFIASLSALLREHDLSEIEVRREYGEDNALDVRVARTAAAAPVVAAPAPAPAAAAPQAAAPQPSAPPPQAATEDPAQDPGAITSPMVGTAYLQAEPGAPSFVSVGDKVSEGQTVLIIEAMKPMNQLPAPRGGTVEFGAPLLILE